ncbi:MAG: DoxX family protein [Candidatus Nanohaloarchaea archaeon]|nr:DoxX family protein [Candidatus Nanohaloarchaea archaeon]
MVFESQAMQISFLIGRILYGGLLAFMGLNHFMDLENMTEHAKANNVVLPGLSVLASGILLVLGGLSIAFGSYTFIGSILLALFFVLVTPKMHNFWSYEGEDRHQQMIHFFKNVLALGAALAFLSISSISWPMALGAFLG